VSSEYVRGKVVIVTGGSSGFGLEAARLLLEQEAKVVITGRDEGRLRSAAAELAGGDRLLTHQADAAVAGDWPRLIDRTLERFGVLDVLVNNAGAGVRIAPIEEMDDRSIAETLNTNLAGVIFGCREAVRAMRPRGKGLIVNVASCCCHYSWPNWSVYTAAKAGLVGLTKCLCKEMLAWGGRASLFVPAAARTNFCQAANLDESWQAGFPDAKDFARALLHIIDQPDHCVIQELSIWGTEQVKTMLNPY
jgi:NAD(P)-dependent dehydrogenase (short-subunit alcohol dehydrogenase family)